MSQLATSIALSLSLAHERAAEERRAEAWRRLHRRPDALPESMAIVPAARRRRLAALLARRPHRTPLGG